MKPRIAVLDDEPRMAEVIAMVLRGDEYEVESFTEPARFLEAFDESGFDLLLSDLKMPDMDGVQVLAAVKERAPHTPVILVTAYATVETALAAMKTGAADYLTKPIDNEQCRALVARALEVTRLARENRHMRSELRGRYGIDSIVAESSGMQGVVELLRRAASARSTALITGESGTGKELVARAIHFHSGRVGGPFVAVNCKAFAEGVVESELFGHEKGSFTGASQRRSGVFERAHGGTLFLDEIGEVSADFQAKLLRVLQEREVHRVGGEVSIPVDVRLLAATNRDLRAEVDAGRFREDLYFRLAVIPIEIPPLRERRDDIVPIARAVLERQNAEQGRKLTGWTDEVEAWLVKHDWPGNVRELENTLERGVVLSRGEEIELGDLVIGEPGKLTHSHATLTEHLDATAADYIRAALAQTDGARQAAAKLIGVERTTLYRLMKRYGIGSED